MATDAERVTNIKVKERILDRILAVDLRNALVHFEPDWIDYVRAEVKLAHKFEKRFEGTRPPVEGPTQDRVPRLAGMPDGERPSLDRFSLFRNEWRQAREEQAQVAYSPEPRRPRRA